MDSFDKIYALIDKKFKSHPDFYKLYRVKTKLFIAFSDMLMCVTPVGGTIYFVEVYDKLGPTDRKLLYAQLCKTKPELMNLLANARKTFVKPPPPELHEKTRLNVDIKHLLKKRLKTHPKFEMISEVHKKLFISFEDILITVEPIGGTFYSWELFKRDGKLLISSNDAGAKIGFDRIVDTVVELREKYTF